MAGDLTEEEHCRQVVERTVDELGGLHVLLNNVAYQQPQDSPTAITTAQWERTLRTNITSYFFLASTLSHQDRCLSGYYSGKVLAPTGGETLPG